MYIDRERRKGEETPKKKEDENEYERKIEDSTICQRTASTAQAISGPSTTHVTWTSTERKETHNLIDHSTSDRCDVFNDLDVLGVEEALCRLETVVETVLVEVNATDVTEFLLGDDGRVDNDL